MKVKKYLITLKILQEDNINIYKQYVYGFIKIGVINSYCILHFT